jgi:EAL domain-containing protein (putative c-di-GMP-specific phosphodiesterase class I)
MGGDGFAILNFGFESTKDVEKLAAWILTDFNEAFEIKSNLINITASIGIAFYSENGMTMEELLKNARVAMRKAKEEGKNRISHYNGIMHEAAIERMIIENQLRTALRNRQFELYYQPQLDILNNRISGFEALLRWNNPVLGFVTPMKFISIAEETNLIIPIGEWVIRNASMFLKRLNQQGFSDLSISINVSMLQILQDNFVDMVLGIFDEVGVDPRSFEIEITESVLMETFEIISPKLECLHKKGVRIALDDFGKGYSSLNYLRFLPISTLKIDKSFIDTIFSDKKNETLTNLIVKIGRSMKLSVVAEGVENQKQMDYLVKHRCDRVQGFLYSRPLPEREAMKKILKQGDINWTDIGREIV